MVGTLALNARRTVAVAVLAGFLAGCAPVADPTEPPVATSAAPTPAPESPSPTPSPSSTPPDGPEPAAVPPGFVTRVGRELVLDGSPFRFSGLNIYNATSLEEHGCSYGMGTRPTVERSLDEIGPGHEVIRSWFFQYQATVDGRRDWSTFDAVLETARSRGYKVIPVLINQWGDCEGWEEFEEGYKPESWYQTGYRTLPTSPGMQSTYEEWVREVVTRYRDEPAVIAWQLVNEAEAGVEYDGGCTETATATMVDFAAHMGRLVKEIDPHHLLSLGTIGTGQCGLREEEYFDVHSVPEIDLCEYHDYNDVRAVPGDRSNGLRRRIAQCAALDKPLFVGEVGLSADEVDGTLEGRADVLGRKVEAQTGLGVVGMLAWLWRDGAHGGSSLDSYDIGPGDPALAVLSGT